MAEHVGPGSETYEGMVLEVVQSLLGERAREKSEVTAWVTSTEIAEATGLDRDVVVDALEGLSAQYLHVAPVTGTDEVEVLGLRPR
jgi:hypothetical protein